MVDGALATLTTPTGYASALGQVVTYASRQFHFYFLLFPKIRIVLRISLNILFFFPLPQGSIFTKFSDRFPHISIICLRSLS